MDNIIINLGPVGDKKYILQDHCGCHEDLTFVDQSSKTWPLRKLFWVKNIGGFNLSCR
jgi:hypothetical protein